MAITYPRELPNYSLSECWLDLDDNVSASASGRGNFINLSQVVDPQWKVTIKTGLLTIEQQAVWSSWRKSLRGLKAFLAYDVRRKTPLAYPNAKQPSDIADDWNGNAAVSSLGLSGALGLTGLPINYQFKAGDRVGLVENSHYGYHEIIEDVTANGAGVATVTVSPFLFTTLFTTAAVAKIWQPRCQLILDGTSWSEQGTVEISPITFQGIQRL